jgi:hypothetical protein
VGVLENPRQEAFARARALQGLTNAEAYVQAGYKGNPENQGDKVCARPAVRARIAELQTKVEDKLTTEVVQRESLSRDFVFRELQENIESAKKTYVTNRGAVVYLTNELGQIIYDANGKAIPVYERDHRAINESLKLIGMEFDMFQIKQQIDVRRKHFESLTLEEIQLELQNRLEVDFGVKVELEDIQRMLRGEAPSRPELAALTIEIQASPSE